MKVEFTQRDACKYLGICNHTFNKLNVPGYKIGKRILYYKSDLDRVKNENDICRELERVPKDPESQKNKV